MARHEPPEIFSTDRGGQFTSPRFAGVLRDAGVRISMNGRSRHRARDREARTAGAEAWLLSVHLRTRAG